MSVVVAIGVCQEICGLGTQSGTNCEHSLNSPVDNAVAVDVYQCLQQGAQHLASYEALTQALPADTPAVDRAEGGMHGGMHCTSNAPAAGDSTTAQEDAMQFAQLVKQAISGRQADDPQQTGSLQCGLIVVI